MIKCKASASVHYETAGTHTHTPSRLPANIHPTGPAPLRAGAGRSSGSAKAGERREHTDRSETRSTTHAGNSTPQPHAPMRTHQHSSLSIYYASYYLLFVSMSHYGAAGELIPPRAGRVRVPSRGSKGGRPKECNPPTSDFNKTRHNDAQISLLQASPADASDPGGRLSVCPPYGTQVGEREGEKAAG